MKNFIITVLTIILLTIVGYYCYVYYYKKETFQSDRYKLPIDNSKLTQEMFPNYKIVEKPVTEKEIVLGFVKKTYSLDGSSLFEDIRTYYYRWFEKSNVIKNIRKNPEKITTLFNDYKKDFYKLVPYSTFRNSNIKTIFDLLIMSYDDLYKNPDLVNKNMKTIYGSMISSNNDETYIHYDYYIEEDIMTPQSKEIFDVLYKSKDSKFTETDRNWFYSFWARRFKEDNINQTIAIIREVSNHYNPDFDESNE